MSDVPPPDFQGGSGGDAREDDAPLGHGIRDRRLARRALLEGWDMRPALRTKLLQELVNIVDPEYEHDWKFGAPGHRERVGAAKVLAAVFAQNLQLEKLRLDAAKLLLEKRRVEVEEKRLELLTKKPDGCPTARDVLKEAEDAAANYRPPEKPDAPTPPGGPDGQCSL